MRACDLTTGTGKLRHALRTLEEVRLETEEHWKDANGRNFFENHMNPLEPKCNAAINSVNHLAQVFAKIEQACRDD